MSKKVVVSISPTGDIEVVPFGYQGEECLSATKAFEGVGVVKSEMDLPEMYQEKEKQIERVQA